MAHKMRLFATFCLLLGLLGREMRTCVRKNRHAIRPKSRLSEETSRTESRRAGRSRRPAPDGDQLVRDREAQSAPRHHGETRRCARSPGHRPRGRRLLEGARRGTDEIPGRAASVSKLELGEELEDAFGVGDRSGDALIPHVDLVSVVGSVPGGLGGSRRGCPTSLPDSRAALGLAARSAASKRVLPERT